MSEEAQAFYARNYDLLDYWLLKPGEKVVLGAGEPRRCRFCGLEPPEVTFSSEAHAIPELTGNRSLFTAYECDACNHFFGRDLENHFGNWSKTSRTFSRVRGKKSIPAIRSAGADDWRIQPTPAGLEITGSDYEQVVEDDPAAKTLTIRLATDTYTPVQVLKAFVKIGLSLMPSDEMLNFGAAVHWLRQSEAQPGLIIGSLPILYTFWPYALDTVVAFLLRRTELTASLPYAFLVLAYRNEIFQVPLPTPERDASFAGKKVPLYHYPFPMPPHTAPELVKLPRYSLLDLTGREPVRGSMKEVVLSYGQAIPRENGAPA
jgi:hypothetical protein